MSSDLTQARLHVLFHYDSETGEFIRKTRTSNSTRIGEVAGAVQRQGYIQLRVDGVLYLAHRLAWLYMTGRMPDDEIDHRDLNKSNNSWGNLRPADGSLNNANKPTQKNNSLGLKGVSKHNGGPKYRADVRINGRQKYLGCFPSREAASKAYAEAANDAFGEYARSA